MSVQQELNPMLFESLAKLSPVDNVFLTQMLEQYRRADRRDLAIGSECLPTCFLTQNDRVSVLNEVDGREVEEDLRYAQIAAQTTVFFHELNAGLGSSMGIESHRQDAYQELGLPPDDGKATKGSGTYYRGEDGKLYSGSQIKANRILAEAPKLGQIQVCMVVSEDSEPVMRAVYEGRTPYGDGQHSYTELFAEAGNIEFGKWLYQGSIPTLNEQGELTTKRTAPGSHGQVGMMVINGIMNRQPQTPYEVSVIVNGDGPSNFVTPAQLGYTASEAGIVLDFTDKVPALAKGGALVVRRTPSGLWVPDIMELAQAEKAGQRDLFLNMGLEGTAIPHEFASKHQPGEQRFNLNNASFNNPWLHTFFNAIVKQRGVDYFNQFATPEVMFKKQKDPVTEEPYTQLEGSLSSLLFRMNAAVMEDPELTALWNEISGGKPFFRIRRLDPELTARSFSPVKFAIDHFLYDGSGLCTLDTNEWYFRNNFNRPYPRFEGDLITSSSYYADVGRVHNALGGADMKDLHVLDLRGKVTAQNAVWIGDVHVDATKSPRTVNLRNPWVRNALGLNSGEPLIIDNLHATSIKDGKIERTQ